MVHAEIKARKGAKHHRQNRKPAAKPSNGNVQRLAHRSVTNSTGVGPETVGENPLIRSARYRNQPKGGASCAIGR